MPSHRLDRILSAGVMAAAAFAYAAGMAHAGADAAYPREQLEARADTHAYVARGLVMAPKGRFLLIRNGQKACAVRFTDFRRGREAKPEAMFNAGDASYYARYEWFFLEGGRDLSPGSVLSGMGTASEVVLAGIGRLPLHLSKDHVKCGALLLRWHYPAAVAIVAGGKGADQDFEMAPTRWSRIEDVRMSDPNLRWYGNEGPGKAVFIPIDGL